MSVFLYRVEQFVLGHGITAVEIVRLRIVTARAMMRTSLNEYNEAEAGSVNDGLRLNSA